MDFGDDLARLVPSIEMSEKPQHVELRQSRQRVALEAERQFRCRDDVVFQGAEEVAVEANAFGDRREMTEAASDLVRRERAAVQAFALRTLRRRARQFGRRERLPVNGLEECVRDTERVSRPANVARRSLSRSRLMMSVGITELTPSHTPPAGSRRNRPARRQAPAGTPPGG